MGWTHDTLKFSKPYQAMRKKHKKIIQHLIIFFNIQSSNQECVVSRVKLIRYSVSFEMPILHKKQLTGNHYWYGTCISSFPKTPRNYLVVRSSRLQSAKRNKKLQEKQAIQVAKYEKGREYKGKTKPTSLGAFTITYSMSSSVHNLKNDLLSSRVKSNHKGLWKLSCTCSIRLHFCNSSQQLLKTKGTYC